MTNIIREKHIFRYHDKQFYCSDLTWGDYLFILQNEEEGIKKILLEHNKQPPKLNRRQIEEFIKIIFGMDQEEKGNSKVKIEELILMEGQVMNILKQPLSEIRSWTVSYFMNMYKELPYITGAKEYSKDRHSTKPDKKKFKKEFGNFIE